MRCPIHGTTFSAADQDDLDIACPDCRQSWSTRADLYELPRRNDDERRAPHADG